MASNQMQSDPTSGPKDPSFPDPLDLSFTADVKYKLATYFAPQFNLCPSERYGFMNATTYVDKMCDYKDKQGQNVETKKDPDEPVETTNEKESEKKDGPALEWNKTYQDQYIPDENNIVPGVQVPLPPVDDHIQGSKDARLYTHFQIEENTDKKMIRLVYSVFYPFNGVQPVQVVYNDNPDDPNSADKSFYTELSPMGQHQGDWERVTVFIKFNPGQWDISPSHTDPSNWEIYCVYASQHGKYAVGFPKKYYNMYNDKSDYFKSEFIASQPQQKEPEIVEQIELKDNDNGQTCMIYVSFNTHANQFKRDTYIHLSLPIDKLRKLYEKLDEPSEDLDNLAKTVKYINFIDCTTYGDMADGQVYYAFGAGQKEIEEKEGGCPLGSESATLILKEKVDEKEDAYNYYEFGSTIVNNNDSDVEPLPTLEKLNFSEVWTTYRWGQRLPNLIENLSTPINTVNKNDQDKDATGHNVINGVIQAIHAFFDKTDYGIPSKGPQAPIYTSTNWWLDKEPCPFRIYSGIYSVNESSQRIALRPSPMSDAFTVVPLGKFKIDELSIIPGNFEWIVGSGSFSSKTVVLYDKVSGAANTYALEVKEDILGDKTIKLRKGDKTIYKWNKAEGIVSVISNVIVGNQK